MARVARSANGDIVDFDLLVIKQRLTAAAEIKPEENLLDSVVRRRRNRKPAVVVPEPVVEPVAVAETVAEDPQPEKKRTKGESA